MTGDASARAASNPRFTLGLALDVAKVLADHGYEPVTEGRVPDREAARVC